jgi:hypothetical protein
MYGHRLLPFHFPMSQKNAHPVQIVSCLVFRHNLILGWLKQQIFVAKENDISHLSVDTRHDFSSRHEPAVLEPQAKSRNIPETGERIDANAQAKANL